MSTVKAPEPGPIIAIASQFSSRRNFGRKADSNCFPLNFSQMRVSYPPINCELCKLSFLFGKENFLLLTFSPLIYALMIGCEQPFPGHTWEPSFHPFSRGFAPTKFLLPLWEKFSAEGRNYHNSYIQKLHAKYLIGTGKRKWGKYFQRRETVLILRVKERSSAWTPSELSDLLINFPFLLRCFLHFLWPVPLFAFG